MWRTGGRSSALDRAQRLLSAKRSGGDPGRAGGPGGPGGPGDRQECVQRPVPSRPAVLSFSDLSQESSASLAAEPGPPHAEGPRGAEVCVGRSRFLKKPPAATGGSRSQEHPEPSRESWSQRPSQTAALSRLSAIESRVRVRKQTLDQARRGMKAADTLNSDLSPAAAAAASRSAVDADQSAVAFSGDPPAGSHALKKRASGAAGAADVGVGFRMAESPASRRPDGERPLTTEAGGGVSLESDEEDMRKLLGDSPASAEASGCSGLEQSGSGGKKEHPSAPPTTESPHRPRRASPFRFAGQAQARFSPSALSPPPSPRPAERPGPSSSSSSSSSSTGGGGVRSLEELFPARPHCQETHSAASSVSSGDFRVVVRSLEELLPAAVTLTGASPTSPAASHGVQSGTERSVTASPAGNQQLERDEEEEEEEDYLSDFESESRWDQSASQVSEDVPGDGGVEEELSEVSSCSDTSRGKKKDYWSVSGGSGRAGGSSRDASERVRRSAAARTALKEAAVQTQADYMEHTLWSGLAAAAYLDSTAVLTHTRRAGTVEAPGTFSPAALALSEVLKQQLVAMRLSIQSKQQRHCRLLQSLEPPGYTYTTLEDTQQRLERRRAATLSLEDAAGAALQEPWPTARPPSGAVAASGHGHCSPVNQS